MIKAILCFPFFYLGIYIREINSKRIFNLNVLLLLLLLQFSVCLSEINGSTNLMLSDFKMGYVLFIINTFPMTLFLMNLFSKIPPRPSEACEQRGIDKLTSIVVTISNGTLLILGIHGILIGIFNFFSKYSVLVSSITANVLRILCVNHMLSYYFVVKKYMPILLGI